MQGPAKHRPNAAFATTTLSITSHTITATYNGDTNCQPANSGSVIVKVNRTGGRLV